MIRVRRDGAGGAWPRRAFGGAALAAWMMSAALVAAPLAGCGGGEEGGGGAKAPSAPPAAPPAPAPPETPAGKAAAIPLEEAKRIFVERCSSCHGEHGRGDGPAAQSLYPAPRNFHDPEWQAKVTDEHLTQVISYGGAAVGLSPVMPAHPDLANQPEVLAGLVNYIRSLGQQP